jgi:hypothetical protein
MEVSYKDVFEALNNVVKDILFIEEREFKETCKIGKLISERLTEILEYNGVIYSSYFLSGFVDVVFRDVEVTENKVISVTSKYSALFDESKKEQDCLFDLIKEYKDERTFKVKNIENVSDFDLQELQNLHDLENLKLDFIKYLIKRVILYPKFTKRMISKIREKIELVPWVKECKYTKIKNTINTNKKERKEVDCYVFKVLHDFETYFMIIPEYYTGEYCKGGFIDLEEDPTVLRVEVLDKMFNGRTLQELEKSTWS